MIREILLLGNPRLYEVSENLRRDELDYLPQIICDLHDTLIDFRVKYGAGRAIAAPQIGIRKRIIYMNTEQPVTFINPVLSFQSDETFEVLDDCMSFPGLLVRVKRYKSCAIKYLDEKWNERVMEFSDGLSELLQHEYDHLDGVLATMRAIDGKSFIMRKT